jgi:hypothetical protein
MASITGFAGLLFATVIVAVAAIDPPVMARVFRADIQVSQSDGVSGELQFDLVVYF